MTDITNQKHRLLTRGSPHDRHDACDMLDALAKERDELAARVKYLEGVGEVDGKLIQKTAGDAVRYKGQAEKAEAEVERLRNVITVELTEARRIADADLESQAAMERVMDYPMERTYTPAMKRFDRLKAALQRKEGNE